MSYWYLEREQSGLVEKPLPSGESVEKIVLEKAIAIQLAEKLQRFKCKQPDGCFACKPYELIVRGEAEYVGMNNYKEDVFVLDTSSSEHERGSDIL